MDCSVIHFAALRSPYRDPSFIEVVSLLLRKGARLEKSAALSGAIQSTNSRNENVKFLLGQGADPNTDVDASTPPPPRCTQPLQAVTSNLSIWSIERIQI